MISRAVFDQHEKLFRVLVVHGQGQWRLSDATLFAHDGISHSNRHNLTSLHQNFSYLKNFFPLISDFQEK